MVGGFYRIGQASKELGVSSYHLRCLCQAGAIEAELTAGNQWRVPISEVTRLEREGVPPIPQRLPDADEAVESEHPIPRANEERRTRVPEGLYADPSDGVINAAEEVTITENRLRKRRLERELEEEEDFFRERAARATSESEAERERTRKEQEKHKRREWENAWLMYALERIPCDAPRELELDVHTHSVEALSKLQADQPVVAVRRVIEAAVERALATWRFQSRQQHAVVAALNSLPYDLRYRREFVDQKHEAARLATIAVQQCPPGCGRELMESAATRAVKPIAEGFEHARVCREIVSWTSVRGATFAELDEAKEIVSVALLKLPAGCTRAQMERSRDAALAPLAARVAERVRAEETNAAEQRRRKDAERRVDWQLGHIERYLGDAYEYDDYDGIRERFADARRLKESIRPTLIQECMDDSAIDDEDVRSRIEELVDEHL